MDSAEVEKELGMTYQELVGYLLEKYGPAKHDYFCNETCRSKNRKVTRSKEGLVCHHIDEDKAILLSNPLYAVKNPFEYQKASRLVYSNILEHLLLHIKIVEDPRHECANPLELPGMGGAVNFIGPQINDYYDGFEYKRPYEKTMFAIIENNFDDYIKMLKYFLKVPEKRPEYMGFITKERLSKTYVDQHIVSKVYNRL